MIANEHFRDLLEAGDLKGLRAFLFTFVSDEKDLEPTMHRARTAAENIKFDARAYSHAWLLERGLHSLLPDHLKPKAQRLYPVVVDAVGISVNFSSQDLKPAGKIIQKAMSDAVEDIYANGDKHNIPLIHQRMKEARSYEIRKLFGKTNLRKDI